MPLMSKPKRVLTQEMRARFEVLEKKRDKQKTETTSHMF